MPQLVPHLRTRKRQKHITPEANQPEAHHPDRLCLSQRFSRHTSSAHLEGDCHRNWTLHGRNASDKQQLFEYASSCIKTYICEIESRRHPSIRPRAHLKALAQDVAAEIGTLSLRHALHAPACSSQSQGNIERLHQTPFGQVRIIREMIRQTYNVSLSMNHPVTPWLISRSAHLINTNLAHSYGHTSYFRRWQCDNKLPIWEFGETILYMIPGAVKHQPKLENRFSPGIWLGKDTTSGESFIGITRRIVKARTIKRQAAP